MGSMKARSSRPSALLHLGGVGPRVWALVFVVSWGPIGYAVSVALDFGGLALTFVFWTGFWGSAVELVVVGLRSA